MSSTTKTNKLGLSQFLGTDVPDWRTDYNSDMSKIDKEFQDAEENILDTAEEIKANTYEKKYAGASGVQELFSEISESLNVQKNIDAQISYTQPTGDVHINSIRTWTKGNVCGVSLIITNTGDWAVGGTITVPVSGFPKALCDEWNIGLVVGVNPVYVYKNTANNQLLLRNLGSSKISPFENYTVSFTYAI